MVSHGVCSSCFLTDEGGIPVGKDVGVLAAVPLKWSGFKLTWIMSSQHVMSTADSKLWQIVRPLVLVY